MLAASGHLQQLVSDFTAEEDFLGKNIKPGFEKENKTLPGVKQVFAV